MPSDTDTLIASFIREGSKAHYALLLTPAHQRLCAAAVLAFDAQMREICGVSPDVAPAKLHWWHEEIDRLRDGQPRHPITRAFGPRIPPGLADCLNERLHGAVVDFNAAEIVENDFERYLHMRSGALFVALATSAGRDHRTEDKAAGVVCAISDLLHESRDPDFADVPVANLAGVAAIGKALDSDRDAELAIEAVLCVRRDQAVATLANRTPGSITGNVLLALYKLDWPRIIASPPGSKLAPSSPWSRLWTAWRAARQHRRRGPLREAQPD